MEQIPIISALSNDITPNPPPAPTPLAVTATPVPEALSSAAAGAMVPAPGTPPGDLTELSASQVRALETLAAGCSLADAARAADVNPGTIYRWKKTDPHFIAALNAWRLEAITAGRDRVLALANEATRAAYRLLCKDNPMVTVAILKTLGNAAAPKPGADDAKAVDVALHSRERRREENRKARLRSEAAEIREKAKSLIMRRKLNSIRAAETRALEGTAPQTIVREHRRADQLLAQAEGLETADDLPPTAPPTLPPPNAPEADQKPEA